MYGVDLPSFTVVNAVGVQKEPLRRMRPASAGVCSLTGTSRRNMSREEYEFMRHVSPVSEEGSRAKDRRVSGWKAGPSFSEAANADGVDTRMAPR